MSESKYAPNVHKGGADYLFPVRGAERRRSVTEMVFHARLVLIRIEVSWTGNPITPEKLPFSWATNAPAGP